MIGADELALLPARRHRRQHRAWADHRRGGALRAPWQAGAAGRRHRRLVQLSQDGRGSGRHAAVSFPFHELDNVVMSPHRAGYLSAAEEERMIHLANLLNVAAAGEPMPNHGEQGTWVLSSGCISARSSIWIWTPSSARSRNCAIRRCAACPLPWAASPNQPGRRRLLLLSGTAHGSPFGHAHGPGASSSAPSLRIVPATTRRYSRVSRQVMAAAASHHAAGRADLHRRGLSGCQRPPRDRPWTWPWTLQATIRDELGLPCSLGVATNKLVAKIANNVGKAQARTATARPMPSRWCRRARRPTFWRRCPCEELWGVGPKTAERLHELGIETIGDIAAGRKADLTALFGKHGSDLSLRAQRHRRHVRLVTDHEPKSVSQERTFARDIDDVRRTARRILRTLGRRRAPVCASKAGRAAPSSSSCAGPTSRRRPARPHWPNRPTSARAHSSGGSSSSIDCGQTAGDSRGTSARASASAD